MVSTARGLNGFLIGFLMVSTSSAIGFVWWGRVFVVLLWLKLDDAFHTGEPVILLQGVQDLFNCPVISVVDPCAIRYLLFPDCDLL